MGIEYYLVRDDNDTAFDLGKGTFEWRKGFVVHSKVGRSVLYQLPEQVETLAQAFAEAWREWPPDVEASYYDEVAREIFTWADGNLFRVVDDQESVPLVTGSRYR